MIDTWMLVLATSLIVNVALGRLVVTVARENKRLRISNDSLVEDLAELHMQKLQVEIRRNLSTARPNASPKPALVMTRGKGWHL